MKNCKRLLKIGSNVCLDYVWYNTNEYKMRQWYSWVEYLSTVYYQCGNPSTKRGVPAGTYFDLCDYNLFLCTQYFIVQEKRA